MRSVRSPLPPSFTVKTCLSCGYRGPELQGRRGRYQFVCPECGTDLYERPARSYAELEGLAEPDPAIDLEPDWAAEAPPSRWRAAFDAFAGWVRRLLRRR
jgi:predicted RNA-binding Zn-ribbon protein involved in translation (DUF1610 family)